MRSHSQITYSFNAVIIPRITGASKPVCIIYVVGLTKFAAMTIRRKHTWSSETRITDEV